MTKFDTKKDEGVQRRDEEADKTEYTSGCMRILQRNTMAYRSVPKTNMEGHII